MRFREICVSFYIVAIPWFNSLCHCDVIWGHIPGLILAHVTVVAWRHQAITWNNVDLSSMRPKDIHLNMISLGISQPSIVKMNLKITKLKFLLKSPSSCLVWYGMGGRGNHTKQQHKLRELKCIAAADIQLAKVSLQHYWEWKHTSVHRTNVIPTYYQNANVQFNWLAVVPRHNWKWYLPMKLTLAPGYYWQCKYTWGYIMTLCKHTW